MLARTPRKYMAQTTPFESVSLKRDWIEGVTGESFGRRVHRRVVRIEQTRAAKVRGVLIVERDPVAFAAAFFAAVSVGVPVILGNRRWARREWEALQQVVNPARIFGESPLDVCERHAFDGHPAAGTILIPTGGSSGGVKLAIHTWETLSAACEGVHDFLGEGPMNNCCVLPLYHVSGLMQLMRSFLTGGRIAFPDFQELKEGRFPPFELGTLCLSLVPTQLQRLVVQQRISEHLMLARALFIGGGPLPLSVAEQARALKLPLVLSYGMTETAAMVAALSPDEFLAGESVRLQLLSHVEVETISPEGRHCELGESGRICIRAKSLFLGYHGQRSLDLRAGYLTDDEGVLTEGRRLQVLGRTDRIIISGGEKIDPREVESVIMETGTVEQVMVLGWPDEEWGQKLVAFYVLAGVITDTRKWEEALRADLVNYKIPKLMIQVPILPLDNRGKVDRRLMQSLIDAH